MADHGREVSSLVPSPTRSARSVVPILAWLPAYRWKEFLAADLVAGVALAALLIPESMGYAGVAGVSPEVGLYAALGAVLAYALLGGVSILVVGPASAVAALSASLVAEFSGDVDRTHLIAALALTSGVIYAVMGILRLGWIVNFISRPVLHAFIAGLSISIIVGQLDGLLGLEVEGESVVRRALDVIGQLADAHGLTTAIGIGALAGLLAIERFAEKVPAAVVVATVGILLVVLLDLADDGVAIVGDIPTGLPSVAVPELSGTRWLELLGGGLALVLVGFSEGFAAASATADGTGEDVDPDQELLANGGANLAAGLLGGLAVGGSLSKSSASASAGARSQMTNLVGGILVLCTLLFLAPVFEQLPEAILAAIVIAAVLRSADPRRVLDLWTINRLDFVAGVITFVLVLVWETLPAMIVGVVLSLAFAVRRSSFPDVVEIEPGFDGVFRRVEAAGSLRSDGDRRIAYMRFEAPLIYSNALRLQAAADTLMARHPSLERLVVDGEMFSDLDSSGAETLERLDEATSTRGVELHLARLHHRARAQIARSALSARFVGRLHDSLDEAGRFDATGPSPATTASEASSRASTTPASSDGDPQPDGAR